MDNLDKKEEWTLTFISPKTLAEEMAVSLIRTGIKTYREVTDDIDKIKTKAHSCQEKTKKTIESVKSIPGKIVSKSKMSIKNKLDEINKQLSGIKTNIHHKIKDIENNEYEVKKNNITVNIPKPSASKADISGIELELIQPKEMAQTLYASTGEIKQSTKELFEAISKLAKSVSKFVRNMAPVKHKEATAVVVAR